ncbi:MAG: di-heme oxidoredictase family protein [Myxococcota bacterium]
MPQNGLGEIARAAVLWHGGEAEAAREAFRTAPQDQREDLVRFLESL